MLDIVDDKDNIIGQSSRDEIHKNNLIHRSVHILVFNSMSDLFLQKRSMAKDENPGLWDTSAAGHVALGEDYHICAIRELEEELGISANIREIMRLPAQLKTNWEHVRLYKCITNMPININYQEISEGRYFTVSKISQFIKSNPSRYTSSFRLIFNRYINK